MVFMWDFLTKFEKPEEQEVDSAVLILNQLILCSPELIKCLWERAAIRAIADGGSNRWLEFIEKNSGENLSLPDFISGDFDSIKPRTRDYFNSKQVKFVPTPDQDETDFTKALRCVHEIVISKKIKIKKVMVICENAGRFDQVIGNINTLHRSKDFVKDIPVIILSSQSVTWVLQPGTHCIKVLNDYVKGQYACGLMPFRGSTIITTTGLKWNLDNDESEMGGLISTSNTYASTDVTVICDKEVVWTTQYSKID